MPVMNRSKKCPSGGIRASFTLKPFQKLVHFARGGISFDRPESECRGRSTRSEGVMLAIIVTGCMLIAPELSRFWLSQYFCADSDSRPALPGPAGCRKSNLHRKQC